MIRSVRSVAAGVLLLTALAACSASPTSSDGVATLESAAPAGASAEPSASLAPEDAMLAFAACMREQGIDMPDPEIVDGPGGGGGRITFGDGGGTARDQEKFQAAMEECDEFLEQAREARGEIDPEQLDRMLEFAGCMREHGIPMPDPNADGGIRIQRNADGNATNGDDLFDPESPEFQAAEEACRPILGDDFPGGGPTTQSRSGNDSGGSVDIAPEPAKP
jgi:hypothetical protein